MSWGGSPRGTCSRRWGRDRVLAHPPANYDIMLSQYGDDKAQLLVRKLDEDVEERLRQRAARHGRSMEEEVRDILRAAADQDVPLVSPPLGTRISQRFAGLGLTGELPELRGEAADAADLGA